MTWTAHTPSYPLSEFITCFWCINHVIPYSRERILPTGTVELIINFNTPFRVYDRNQPDRYDLSVESWLVGLQSGYILNEITGRSHMIGIRFKPGGTYPFFRFAASEVNDRIIAMDSIWGRFASEVREQLYELPSMEAQFQRLEILLLRQMRSDLYGFDAVQYAVQMIRESQGNLSIRHLSETVNMSQKHLASQFNRMVGMSPKALARVFRFQNVLHTIDPAKPVDWAEIAYNTSYYDQSHFNRDFMTFTGFTPTAYMQHRTAFYGDALVQGENVHFVPVG